MSVMINEFLELIRRFRSRRKFRHYDLKNRGDYYSLAPFDYYQCIFVHIPKTAGISVSFSLFGNLAWGHHKISDYETIFTPRTLNKYLKFCFVRNPQTRLYSAFTFLKKGGANSKDAEWAQKNIGKYDDFESFVQLWVNKQNIFQYVHFFPQYQFLIDSNNDIKIDFIGKFEQLESDFEEVSRKLNIDAKLESRNITRKPTGAEVEVSEESEAIIREVYQKDFELFGYE